MKRSDLICESGIIESEAYGADVHCGELYGTRFTDISVSEDAAREFGLKQGRYVTVFTDRGDVGRCVADILKEFIPDGSALVTGLGNPQVCSDSLGVKALAHIPATAHLSGHGDFQSLGLRAVSVLEAGVTGRTGVESSFRTVCTARCIGAQSIVAVDSLACSDISRLCSTVQITDTGISPGSGVGNDRAALDAESAGMPVTAIGVPTVIDLDSISDAADAKGLMVTPRNIDALTERFARIIGNAVSLALNPALSVEELNSLII